MSEVAPNKSMENALGILWNSFVDSHLASELTLAGVGLTEYSGGYGFPPWEGTGNFYASSSVHLQHESGGHFDWSVNVLFEQGENDGEHWQHGTVYAHVTIFLTPDYDEQIHYKISNIGLPIDFHGHADLTYFSESVEQMLHVCFVDLKYVFENNGFSDLSRFSRERIKLANSNLEADSSYNWESNPLKLISPRS